MQYKTTTTGLLVLGASLLSSPLMAANGHYVPGIEGVSGASVPPAGLYYRGYLVNYDIDTLRDEHGEAVPGRNTGEVSALANRLIWITGKRFLGADYGMEAILVAQETSLDFEAVGVDDRDSGLGDVFLGPVILGWHGPQWDAVFAAGHWFNNGDFDALRPASVGKGYGTTMLTLGGTWHVDEARRWSVSALSRYEIKTEQDESGITPGDSWLVEWGIGHQLRGGLELGLVGYDAWQLEADDHVPAGVPNDKIEKHAIGGEVGYFWPTLGLGLRGAYYSEYDVESGSEGDLLRLQLTKAW